MPAGLLIVLEGTDSVGKTTQLAHLDARLSVLGIPHTLVREPGGTTLGDAIRHLLLDPAGDVVPPAEALLYMASRAQLVARVIKPALARGDLVIADRFFLSTYAYQVAGRGLNETRVIQSNALAADSVVPTLTLLLRLDRAEAERRLAQRGARDRLENSGAAFHQRVDEAFQRFASPEWQAQHPEAGAILVVDASGTEGEVAERIFDALRPYLPSTLSSS